MGVPAHVGWSESTTGSGWWTGLRNSSLKFPHDRVWLADQATYRSGHIGESSGIQAFRIRQDQKIPLHRFVHKHGCE